MTAASVLASLAGAIARAPLGAHPPMLAARDALSLALDAWNSAEAARLDAAATVEALRVAVAEAEALTAAPHAAAPWPALRWGERGGDGGAWYGGLGTLDAAAATRGGPPPSAQLAAWGVVLNAARAHAASALASLDGWAVRIEAVTPGASTPRVQLRAPGGAVAAEALGADGAIPASAPLLRVSARPPRGTPEAFTLACVPGGRTSAPGWPAWRWRAQLADAALRASTEATSRERRAVLSALLSRAEAAASRGDTVTTAAGAAARQLAAATAAAERFAGLYPGAVTP